MAESANVDGADKVSVINLLGSLRSVEAIAADCNRLALLLHLAMTSLVAGAKAIESYSKSLTALIRSALRLRSVLILRILWSNSTVYSSGRLPLEAAASGGLSGPLRGNTKAGAKDGAWQGYCGEIRVLSRRFRVDIVSDHIHIIHRQRESSTLPTGRIRKGTHSQ